ncbi:MAG: amidohydrolase [Pseudomonadota bacterium]
MVDLSTSLLAVRRRIAAAALALAAAACGDGAPRPADLIIAGGPIYTGRTDAPRVEAVAARGGKIVFVGAAEAVQAFVGPETRTIDLAATFGAGAALYPGFVDAHAHFDGIGMRETTLNLDDVASVAELVARVAAVAAETPAGATIVGRGWIETGWPEGRMPTKEDLDAAAPDAPVVLGRADGHAVVVNSAALAAAGVGPDTPDPDGGRIERGPDGAATGLLVDKAMAFVDGLTTAPSETELRLIFAEADAVYTARGWTGIHNMSVDPDHAPLLETLSDEGAIKIRLYNAIESDGLDALAASGPRASENGRVVTRAVKLYVDGALGSRGAALLAPYSDAPNTDGLLLLSRKDAAAAFDLALRNGVQIAVHAIGDRGNVLVLKWYEDAFARTDAADRAVAEPRWRIEHAQIVRPRDIPRFSALGVIASMQPSHAIGDLHFARARLGDARLDGAYAWTSLTQSGALVAGGSDAPVERGDPLIEFYAAVARRDLKGFQGPDWRPEEALSREEALALFTKNAAYAAFEEDVAGTIEIGKRADFTAFSADIMTIPEAQIPEATAVLTVIDGEIVHQAAAR